MLALLDAGHEDGVDLEEAPSSPVGDGERVTDEEGAQREPRVEGVEEGRRRAKGGRVRWEARAQRSDLVRLACGRAGHANALVLRDELFEDRFLSDESRAALVSSRCRRERTDPSRTSSAACPPSMASTNSTLIVSGARASLR